MQIKYKWQRDHEMHWDRILFSERSMLLKHRKSLRHAMGAPEVGQPGALVTPEKKGHLKRAPLPRCANDRCVRKKMAPDPFSNLDLDMPVIFAGTTRLDSKPAAVVSKPAAMESSAVVLCVSGVCMCCVLY